jgi:GMP synthase-like glutamine amidotransferase
LKIGILAAGGTPARLQAQFGDYAPMFKHLLAGRGYDWVTYDVPVGDYPGQPEDCDGYIVSGSAAGVYDADPWIGDLLRFLRAAKGRAKLVGVCFGHQALAQALGGNVVKSPKGWGIGLHTYGVTTHRPWMDLQAHAFSLSASHQDQVVELPPEATVIAGSDFCPNGALAYDDGMAISCQLHPEFPPDYSIALIDGRKGTRFPVEQADEAIASLRTPDDHEKFAGWVARFLEGPPV